MGPMADAARGGEQGDDGKSSGVLMAAATLYRAPEDLPVVTGDSGAQFASGEEERQSL